MDHRKGDADRREARVPVRLTASQKRQMEAAANEDGQTLSAWFRWLGRERARELGIVEVRDAGTAPSVEGANGTAPTLAGRDVSATGEAGLPPTRKGRLAARSG